MGPGTLPLPGFGSLVQRKGDGGVALVLIPARPLVEAGVVVLADLRAFFKQGACSKIVTDNAKVVLWQPTDHNTC